MQLCGKHIFSHVLMLNLCAFFPCIRQQYRYFCLHSICGMFEVLKVQGVAEERRVTGRSQLQQLLCVSIVGFFMYLFVWSFLLFFNSRRVECPLQRESKQIYQVSYLSLSLPFLLLRSHAPFSSFLYGWFYSLIETAFFSLLTACWLQRGRTDRLEIKVMIGNGSYNFANAIREKHSKHFHVVAPAQNKVSRLRWKRKLMV